MSEARPFRYHTDRDGPVEDRASTMTRFVRDALELVSVDSPRPGHMGLAAIRLTMLGHPNPGRDIDMRRLPNGLWEVSVDRGNRRLGFWAAWEYYLELLAEKEMDKAPADLRLAAFKELRICGEVISLEVQTHHRATNKVTAYRFEELSSRMILWRTFGPRGEPGVGIRQDYHSAHRERLGQITSEGGSVSYYSYWHTSRNRNKGAAIKTVPSQWGSELDQQFRTDIPVKALTPEEWRTIIKMPFTEDDVMTEDK